MSRIPRLPAILAWFSMFALLVVAVPFGCTEGVSGDSDADTDTDVDTDSDSDTDSDTGCVYHTDCSGNTKCDHGECVPANTCNTSNPCPAWEFCPDRESGMPRRCLPVCTTDLECPEDGHCYDGLCERYPLTWSETTPLTGRQTSDRSGLMAGVAEVIDDVPVGITMAGHGARWGQQTAFRHAMGGSRGFFDYPKAQVLVLDDGYEVVVLIEVPMGWSNNQMRTFLAQELQDRLGVNYIDHIITFSQHSHSWPGRYWNLVAAAGLGALGHGDFEGVISERRAMRWADAVEEALASMEPARFGFAVDPSFDPNQEIRHRRRDVYKKLPDGRDATVDPNLLLVRIDRHEGADAGKPMAVIVGYPTHGTIYGKPGEYISGDSPHGVVKATRRAIEDETGAPVVVFFDNFAGGDTSHGSGGFGVSQDYAGTSDFAGLRSQEWIQPLYHSLDGNTSHDTEIRLGFRRVPVSYRDLGYDYEKKEFRDDVNTYGEEEVYIYGAFQCTCDALCYDGYHAEDGDLGCLLSAGDLNSNRPVPQIAKTMLSVLRIGPGDKAQDLFLPTIPGEPHTPLLWLYQEAAEDEHGVPEDHVFFLGFSQDHHLYMMTADDWFYGEYEATMDLWGWKEGDYYAEKSLELLGHVADDSFTVDADTRWIKPMYAGEAHAKYDPVTPVPTLDAEAGKLDPLWPLDDEYERLDLIELKWIGGFPNADWPLVSLEREQGGAWAAVTNAAGVRYNHDGDRFPVDYDWLEWTAFDWGKYKAGTLDPGSRKSDWMTRFEELKDFPTGRYRIRINGTYCSPTSPCDAWGNNLTPYEIVTKQFELVPCTKLQITDLRYEGGEIRGRVAYPPGHIATDNGGISKGVDGRVSMRSYRFRGMDTYPTCPGPLSTEAGAVTVEAVVSGGPTLQATQLSSAGDKPCEWVAWRRDDLSETQCPGEGGTWIGGQCEKRDGRNWRTSGFAIPHAAGGSFEVTVTVTDAWGNSGTVTRTLNN